MVDVSFLQPIPQEHRRHVAARFMYTAWNIWKEYNRRVFEGKLMTAPLVFGCVLEKLGLRQAVLRVPSVTQFLCTQNKINIFLPYKRIHSQNCVAYTNFVIPKTVDSGSVVFSRWEQFERSQFHHRFSAGSQLRRQTGSEFSGSVGVAGTARLVLITQGCG